MGLVLFAPHSEKLGAPAASLVEATLGAANTAPTLEETTVARRLVARLTAEGSVVPLNLLGSPGDVPDFLASAKVFSYIFTLRGDKAWKQPPSTSEGTKVSPLGLRVYEALLAKGAQSANELASELGREVTEAAILRALNELWSQLRVLPQFAADGGVTVWSLASQRFLKAIKAGANAGQPSALSALLSLYLSQAVSATEEEIAGFLSPLTARSRVREVVHALTAARQLEATVVEGRTLLHVLGALPEFAALPEAEATANDAETGEFPAPKKVGTGRIGKFEASAGAEKSSYRGKPAGGASAGRPVRPARYGTGAERTVSPRPDRERRPFKRVEGSAAPSFTKPWDENKRPRREAGANGGEGGAAPRERKPYVKREGGFTGERKPYVKREGGFSGERKPYVKRENGFSAERKPYTKRAEEGASSERRPYVKREGGFSAERKPYVKRETGFSAERKPYAKRAEEGASSERRPYVKREGGFSAERKPYVKREGGFSSDRKPYVKREGGFSSERKPYVKREGGFSGERKPYVKREGGFSSADRKPYVKREAGGDAERPARSFAPKKTFGARADGPSIFSKFRKPVDGERKPYARREGGAPAPRFGGAGKSFGDKPRFGAGKPAGKFGAKPVRPYVKRKPETEE